MQRGVIALPGIINPLENGFQIARGLSKQELFFYALYWDKVVIPTSNLIHSAIQDERLLIETCVVERPRVQMVGSFAIDTQTAFITPLVETAKHLNKMDSDVDWVMHQFGDSILLPTNESTQTNSLKLNIMNALPVPNANEVTIHDVLDFKARRSDEFHKLYDTIDNIYLSILRSPDQPFQEKKEIATLKKDIEDLQAVYREKWHFFHNFSLATEFDIAKIPQVLPGLLLDVLAGNAIQACTALSAIISIKPSLTTSLKSNTNNKLAYLSKAYKEKII